MARLGTVYVFAASVFAAALQFHIATSSPTAERRNWYSGQLTVAPESDHTCEPFDQPYCRCFNPNERTHARFPNRRNQDAADARTEFSDFVNVIKSGCSDKIGGFLCFYYFPFCLEDDSNRVFQQELLPCREVCEEVREDCKEVFVSHGYPWPEFLDCSRDYFKPNTSGECIPVGSDPRQGYNTCVRENATPTDTTTETTTTPTRPTPTVATGIVNSVGPRDPDDEQTPTHKPGPDQCVECKKVRDNCNAGTFKRNSYTWAAHVRVLRNTTVEGMKAFLVEVPEQYLPVTSATPQLENIAVIKTSSPEGCGDCLDAKVVVGTEYLFAGHLQCTADQVTWVLDLSDCLVSDWISKYRRLSKWVKFSTAESNC